MTNHTNHIQLPPKFFADHADRCIDRIVPIGNGKGARIAVELTDDEIVNLLSDALHYSDSKDFEWDGARALASSARATYKAIVQQVENLDDIMEQYKARQRAEREAWEQSPERAALKAEFEQQRLALEEENRINPQMQNLKGRAIIHPETGETVTVRSTGYSWQGFSIHIVDGETLIIEDPTRGGSHARISDIGIVLA